MPDLTLGDILQPPVAAVLERYTLTCPEFPRVEHFGQAALGGVLIECGFYRALAGIGITPVDHP